MRTGTRENRDHAELREGTERLRAYDSSAAYYAALSAPHTGANRAAQRARNWCAAGNWRFRATRPSAFRHATTATVRMAAVCRIRRRTWRDNRPSISRIRSKRWQEGTRKNDAGKQMVMVAKQLSSADITAVSAYFASRGTEAN